MPSNRIFGKEVTMNVLDQVREILAEQTHAPIEELNAHTQLKELGIESVDVIEILFRLEERFDIELPLNANDDVAAKFETIGSVTKAVEDILQAKNST
jgi:acyl carrier protein